MELTLENIRDYLSQTILPKLPFQTTDILGVEEVTDQTYVNWIFRVHLATKDGNIDVYLRQTRDYVKKKPDMKMDPGRIAFEVKMLNFLQTIIPGVVPVVLYFDTNNNAAVLSDIKHGAKLLVHELTQGNTHPSAAHYLGQKVAAVHVAGKGIKHDQVRGSEAANDSAVDFHLGMRLKPALEMFPKETNNLLEQSKKATSCLVLGDLASKNIFIDGSEARFLDLERAFIGDAAFDPAFLFCHYLIEVPFENRPQAVEAINNFMDGYRAVISKHMSPDELNAFENRVLRFLGVTVLYRIFGFYLAVNAQQHVEFWKNQAQKMLNADIKSTISETLHQSSRLLQ